MTRSGLYRLCIVLWLLLPALLRVPSAGASDSTRTAASEVRTLLLHGSPFAHPGATPAARSRSIPLAFFFSAVAPGAGQAYNRTWIKAAASLALEALVITTYIQSNNDGLDAEDAYKAYAHAHWSPRRYAEWVQDYADWLPNAAPATFEIPADIDWSHPETWAYSDVQRVRAFFNDIRAVEARIYHPETGAAFSHKLPYFGEQQYYELIGKYFQFAPGWEDYPNWKTADGSYIDAVIDPERTGPGGSKPNVQGRFRDYARDHAHANDLLRRASRVSALIIVNHLVSAVDAAVTAKLHNDRLRTNVGLNVGPHGRVEPVLSVGLAF